MKKLIPLSILMALFFVACEADGPEPEIAAEIVEVPIDVVPDEGQTTPSDQVFTVVEQMPQFDGGPDAWNNFLQNELNYPEEARRSGIEGKVFASFVVQPDGTLTDITLIRGIGGGCDEEVVRLLAASPAWTPGVQRGRQVPTRMSIAITFKI